MRLLDFLKKDSEIENEQRKTRTFIPDFQEIKNTASSTTPKIRSELFFKNKDIYMSKHNRFAPYPKHSHEFLEFNYQLSGQSVQEINGERYTLLEGDLLLVDTGSVHSIEALEDDDILLNILFNNEMISLEWLRQMQITDSILYKIILNRNNIMKNSNNFLIFREKDNTHLQNTLTQMANEYFFSKTFSSQIISSYLPILLYELSRQYPIDYELIKSEDNGLIIRILDIIDKEYDTITLKKISSRLNYNRNYLSNLIKEQANSTFSELLHEKKMMKARLLIQSTEMPINMIATTVGFSNKTYFYKKYKETFGQLPGEDRKLRS